MEKIESDGERQIRITLDEMGVSYQKEKLLDNLKEDSKEFRIVDFYLPEFDVYIEYFGGWDKADPDKRRKERKRYEDKIHVYKINNITCIYIYPKQLKYLQRAIELELSNYGYSKKKKVQIRTDVEKKYSIKFHRSIIFIISGFMILGLIYYVALHSMGTKFELKKVIDGDTIEIQNDEGTIRLQLIGIDSPEPNECFGKKARRKANEVLTQAGQFIVEEDDTQDKKDKYERLLGYIHLPDGRNFNEMMIREGYASEYTFKKPYKYESDFKNAQRYAQQNNIGIWKNCNQK